MANGRPGGRCREKTFEITVTGKAGTPFYIRCKMQTGAGLVEHAHHGSVPATCQVVGFGGQCQFSTADSITIEIRSEDSVVRTRASGGRVSVELR